MNELMKVSGELTSLKVAEVTGKLHKNVMRDISDEISKIGSEISQLIFEPSNYTDKRGKNYPMYKMTEDGWLQIGARYDAKVRYAMIQYMRKLEQPKTPLQLAHEALIVTTAELQRLEEKVEIMQPKVKVYDTLTNTVEDTKGYSLSETAKLIKFKGGGVLLAKFLRERKILMSGRGKEEKNKPYQSYINKGYFSITLTDTGRFSSVRVTEKGLIALTKYVFKHTK